MGMSLDLNELVGIVLGTGTILGQNVFIDQIMVKAYHSPQTIF